MVVVEAGLTALAGVVAGIVASMGVIAVFMRTIGFNLEQRSINLALPPFWECVLYAFASALAVAGTAVLGAASASWISSAQSAWLLLRGEDT
jgi:hypothetical protein